MKTPISSRLLACCDYVAPGDRIADIGCDHGYLGIHLLLSGMASHVIAADIRPAPLECAVKNGSKYGCADKMTFCLSDGVQSVPRDFDTLVCAGMGADVMISILEKAPWLHSAQYRLVLQCQSKTPMLRRYLCETGWRISRETVLRDGRFLYTVIEAVWAPGPVLTPGECYVSPALILCGSPLLPEYICWVRKHLALSVTGQAKAADSWEALALAELEQIKEENL